MATILAARTIPIASFGSTSVYALTRSAGVSENDAICGAVVRLRLSR